MNHAVSKELQQEIGNFIVTYASFEFNLRNLIASLAGGEQSSSIIVNELSNKSLKPVLASLLMIKKDDMNEILKFNIKNILKEIDNFEKYRNYLIHGLWCTGVDEQSASVSKKLVRQNGVTEQKRLIKKDDLKTMTDFLDAFVVFLENQKNERCFKTNR